MKKQPAAKNSKKKSPAPAVTKPVAKSAAPEKFVPSTFPNWVYFVIMAFCFALYGNTMLNEYALDDTMVLTQNEFVKRGVNGIVPIFKYDTFIGRYGEQVTNLPGGRYRPLSVVMLAVEYEFFAGAETKQIITDKLDPTKKQYTIDGVAYKKTSDKQNDDDAQLYMKTMLPYVNHFMNILLYAIAACFLFKLMLRLFPVRDLSGWKLLFNVPVITTLLFIAHPVHVEAVANIKGRDEIMTFLGALMALFYTLRWLDTRKKKFLAVTFICFLCGAFSKENAITFLVIIPLTVYFFTPYKLKDNLISLLPSLLAALIFLGVRASVITWSPLPETELMNNPFLGMRPYEKWASIIYVLGRYLWLLIWPHPLTTDYYPFHIAKMSFSDITVWLSFIVYLTMMIFVLWGMVSKRKNRYAYAVIWYLVPLTIVSNVFVEIGTFMNERFIYISSVGFCLALAYFMVAHLPKWLKKEKLYHGLVTGFLVIALSLYAIQTISRNRVWFDDFTLSTTDVKASPRSAKSNYDAARVYNIKIQTETDSAKRDFYTRQIFTYAKRAVEIHPNYENALLLLAWSHNVLGSPPDTSLKYLKQLIRRNPQNPFAYDGIAFAMTRIPDARQRAAAWEQFAAIAPDRFDPNYNLACIYAKEIGDVPRSIPYFEKAASLNPQFLNGLIDLGAVYGITGNHVKAAETFEKAILVAPTDTLALKNLWITYSILGDMPKSQQVYEKYLSFKEGQ